MAAQTDEYRGARRVETGDAPVDGRYRLFDEFVSLSDEIDHEERRADELAERLQMMRARREELRNELLDYLGANPNVPAKGLPF